MGTTGMNKFGAIKYFSAVKGERKQSIFQREGGKAQLIQPNLANVMKRVTRDIAPQNKRYAFH